MTVSVDIPEKSFFKMDEVCTITGVKPYVLRFWETEFEQIDPIVSASGKKLYEHKDIQVVGYIKKLLFEEKLNIQQAKAKLLALPITDQEAADLSEGLLEDSTSEVQKQPLEPAPGPEVAPRNTYEITDKQLQKLILARAKINGLLNKIGELEQRHNWSK